MANTALIVVGVILLVASLTFGLFNFTFFVALLVLGIILIGLGAGQGRGLSERVKRIEDRLGLEGEGKPSSFPWLSPPIRTTYGQILRRLDRIEDRIDRLEGGKEPAEWVRPEEVPEPVTPETEAIPTETVAEEATEVIAPAAATEQRGLEISGKPPVEEVPPWERVLGEKWLQWVGLAILATALIFLGALAFELMTGAQKVVTIFAASIGVSLLGEYLYRRGYRSYALGLVGGGLAIAYIAALSAFYLFRILPIATIGATLWTVTIVNALATARYRSPALAGQALVASLVWTALLRLETLTGSQAALLLVGVYALFTLLILYHRHWVLVLGGYGLMLVSAVVFSPLLAPLMAVPLFAAIGFLALFLGFQRYLAWVSFPEVPYATAAGVGLLFIAYLGLIGLQGSLTPLNAAISLFALTGLALWFDQEALDKDKRLTFILPIALLTLVFFLLRPTEWALLPPLIAIATYTAVSHRDYHAHVIAAIALYAAYRLSQGTMVDPPVLLETVGLSILLYALIALFLILNQRFLPKEASIGAGFAALIPAFAVFEPIPFLILVPALLGAVTVSSYRTGNALQSTALFAAYYLFVLLSGSLLAVPAPWVWVLLVAGIVAEGGLLARQRLELPYGLPPLAPWVAALGFPLAVTVPQRSALILLAGALLPWAIALGLPQALRNLSPRLILTALSIAFAVVLRIVLEPFTRVTADPAMPVFSVVPLAVFTLWFVVELLRPQSQELETPAGNVRVEPLLLMISVLTFVLVLGGPPIYLIPPILLVGLSYVRGGLVTFHMNALFAVVLLSFYLATLELGGVPVALAAGIGLGLGALGWELRKWRVLSTPTMLVAEAYVLLGASFAYGAAVGTTLAWAAAGGSLLLYGLAYRDRWVRYGGFVAVFAAVGKIFVADLVGVPIAIRIAALIVVAGLLLAVSFGYARLGRKEVLGPKDGRKTE